MTIGPCVVSNRTWNSAGACALSAALSGRSSGAPPDGIMARGLAQAVKPAPEISRKSVTKAELRRLMLDKRCPFSCGGLQSQHFACRRHYVNGTTGRSGHRSVGNQRHKHVFSMQCTVRRYMPDWFVAGTEVPTRRGRQDHVTASRARRKSCDLNERVRIATVDGCVECIDLREVIKAPDPERIPTHRMVRIC